MENEKRYLVFFEKTSSFIEYKNIIIIYEFDTEHEAFDFAENQIKKTDTNYCAVYDLSGEVNIITDYAMRLGKQIKKFTK